MKQIMMRDGTLYLLAGILFFLAAILGKNFVDILLGCCFIILGINRRKNS